MSKLDDARERLFDFCAVRHFTGADPEVDAELEQAAREFAAAEIEEAIYRSEDTLKEAVLEKVARDFAAAETDETIYRGDDLKEGIRRTFLVGVVIWLRAGGRLQKEQER